LAKSLGLSITTVSRALDGYPEVSEETRRRVLAAAAASNYHPNAAARRLRRNKAETVAVTLPTEPGHFGPPVFLDMLGACSERLAEAGLSLMLVPTPRGSREIETCRRLIEGHRADAMIVVRTHRDDERVAYLLECGIPFVTHGRTAHAELHASIDGDGEAAFCDATLLLAGLGHRRIAHIAAPGAYNFAHLRRTGWRLGMQRADLEADAEAEGEPTENGGYHAACRLLDRPARPSALLCATDSMAIGALRALRERKLAAGRDIAVIGHDNIPAAAFTDPPLSTMEIAAHEVGQRLAALLLRRLGGAEPRDLQEILPIHQVLRATHGPAAQPTA
jgi:LacI family transcriptional regulator